MLSKAAFIGFKNTVILWNIKITVFDVSCVKLYYNLKIFCIISANAMNYTGAFYY